MYRNTQIDKIKKSEGMTIFTELPALICVDLQIGFLDEAHWGGNRNNKNAEAVCARIIARWRESKGEIFHVRHSSADPQSRLHANDAGFAFNPLCAPMVGEAVLTKSVNSCFIGTELQQMLDQAGHRSVVIIGLTTDHCVSTTTRMAGNLGYDTVLISDATATFDKVGVNGETYPSDLIHATALASLKDEFATILTSTELLSGL